MIERGIPMREARRLVDWAVERAFYPPRPRRVKVIRKRLKRVR